jgi:hypothetical protein
MKKHHFLIITSLLISLFIYLFYRTEKTVINEIFISIVSFNTFFKMREYVTKMLSLNEHIIYSLPEALWVFCITLSSKFLFIRIADRELNLLYAPLVFSIGLEVFQLLHLTNGRFDFWDIGLSILFWAIANYFIKDAGARQSILAPFNTRSLICLLTYLIVYLAHVWK